MVPIVNRIKLAAPLTALALLTGACSLKPPEPSGPAPSVSPAGGPALKTVWHIGSDTVDVSVPHVLGDIVVAPPLEKDELVFINATTGRIAGRATGVPQQSAVGATTDERGQPRVIVSNGDSDAKFESVYDPNGHRVWQAPIGSGAQYAGGYVAERQQDQKSGAYQELIQTPAGKVVARVPLGDGYDPDFQVIRPGWLALLINGTPVRVTLIDVTDPGHARVHRLHLPFTTDKSDATNAKMTTGRDRLYVYLPTYHDGTQLAAYQIPDTRPAWHRVVPSDAGYPNTDPEVDVYPDPNGGPDTITLAGGLADSPTTWFLRPDTGAFTGPHNGRNGDLVGVSGGLAYLRVEDSDHFSTTQAVDLRTGAVRTILDTFEGVTTKGYLIGPGLTAYRWTS